VRPCATPFGPSPEEAFSDVLASFELEEVSARAYLRIPAHFREGMEAGRLRTGGRWGLRLVHRRLVFRRPSRKADGTLSSKTVTLRCVETGEIVRLPYA